MHGYTRAPFNAWAGWRLRVPGGPVGGQYHGYLGGIQPEEVWGGTALAEGETVSDHVYRSPGEVRPRANASGGTNVIHSYQTRRSAGYSEAPGNYRALGAAPADAAGIRRVVAVHPADLFKAAPGASTGTPRYLGPPIRAGAGDAVVTKPYDPKICPAWGCGSPHWPGPVYSVPGGGATAVVPQPPPPTTPVVAPVVSDCKQRGPDYFRDAAGNCTNDWHNPYSLYLPLSPRPSPTVDASPSDYLPSQGQVVPGITPGASAPSSFMDWLSASTIWASAPNGVVVGAGALLAYLLLGKKGR